MPEQKEKKMPTANSVASGALIGTPVATVSMWYLNTFVYPGQIPIEIATAAGSVVSTLIATFWHVGAQLMKRIGLSLNPSE